jgi:hypothetical protein
MLNDVPQELEVVDLLKRRKKRGGVFVGRGPNGSRLSGSHGVASLLKDSGLRPR